MQTARTPYSISFMATVLLLLLFACPVSYTHLTLPTIA